MFADLLNWNDESLVLGKQQENCIHCACFGHSDGVEIECCAVVVKVLVSLLFLSLCFHNYGSKVLIL